MSKNLKNIKKQIIETGKHLYNKGFSPGSSGNISFKEGDAILITPSGYCLADLSEKDIATIDIEGNLIGKKVVPSSEKQMHIEIYKRRPDINCLIHSHLPKTTALSATNKEIDSSIIAEAYVHLGKIGIANYETPSGEKLANSVAEGFLNSDAVIMSNHGAVVCGKSLKNAFHKIETLEFLSEIIIITELLGSKRTIPADMLVDLEKIRRKILNT